MSPSLLPITTKKRQIAKSWCWLPISVAVRRISTIVRIGPERRHIEDRKDDILGNSGVRVGGTDFDRNLSFDAVMPLLGLGTELVEKRSADAARALCRSRDVGDDQLHLSAERPCATSTSSMLSPESHKRLDDLVTTATRHLGHRIAFSVEDGKIALSDEDVALCLWPFSRRASRPSRRASISTAPSRPGQIGYTRRRAIASRRQASALPAIDTIFLTGGSSRVPAVRAAIGRAAPSAAWPAARISCPSRWD